MSVATIEEAKEELTKWLEENGHQVKDVPDENASFHFEIDYPLGTQKRQRIIAPEGYPGLIVLLNGVAIADDHRKELEDMTEEDREGLYSQIKKDMMFLENSYDMNSNEKGAATQVQFSYEFYIDSLNKTNLYKGLLLNHRTLLYIVTVFNEKFGIPSMPGEEKEKSPIPSV